MPGCMESQTEERSRALIKSELMGDSLIGVPALHGLLIGLFCRCFTRRALEPPLWEVAGRWQGLPTSAPGCICAEMDPFARMTT